MKTNKDLLTSLLKTTQMGQVCIRSVLDTAMKPELRQALQTQLRAYDAIETEAHTIATQRGWEIRELDPATRFLADRKARMHLTGRNTDSKIAGMMIRSNTQGVIGGLQTLHAFSGEDSRLQILSRRLLDCENANIRQMYEFL